MNKMELEVQKQLCQVFEELKKEIKSLNSTVCGLGWKQRNALISHVYSNYNKHDELNAARNAWEKKITEKNVHQWLYDLMVKHRDLFGYFEDYDEMIAQIEIIITTATKKEQYEIADILVKWRKEMPNSIKTTTQ